ncbi:MAG TPA: selenocysteine-specific translation elongation factor [Actinomycetota bacterium]
MTDAPRDDAETTGELRVVATAGHVDHGKSSLIALLTGIDPDRWAEEKRRGLTIDLGYAWCTLPSGREIGFVDVPGHERFIANMLAGVGPVRLVLFVVAADEGWRPQSEEHLQILDVLGVEGGVVALTKRDLVDDETLAGTAADVRERLAGTALAAAPIVPVSATTGTGLDALTRELDAMVAGAPHPHRARTRLFVDRVFAIKGAGTIVTGTLTGGCLRVGDEVEAVGIGRARIRSLQTHRRDEAEACPVSRVAANLVGIERDRLARGMVLTTPGAWRATRAFDATFRPIRRLGHPISSRGAYKLYAGAAEVDVRLRILEGTRIGPDEEGFVRLRADETIVLDVFDRFVVRESGRRETVGGGIVLDPSPPATGSGAGARLRARADATRDQLPALLVGERGAVRVDEARLLNGSGAEPGRVGAWLVRRDVVERADRELTTTLRAFHEEHPLAEGMDVRAARDAIDATVRAAGVRAGPGLAEDLLEGSIERGVVTRTSSGVRLPEHRAAPTSGSPDVERLLAALGGGRAATPPSIPELVADGIPRAAIDAAIGSGDVVRVSPEFVFARGTIDRARSIVSDAGPGGITVSAFREALGTTRKYAMPILAWFDLRGITRRDGDRRVARDATAR